MSECDDPCCACHVAASNTEGWRIGNPKGRTGRDHGYAQYVRGCRCVECRAASAAYRRSRRRALSEQEPGDTNDPVS